MLVDAPADPVAAAPARKAVLQPRAPVAHRADHHRLLADDLVGPPALVGEACGDAALPGAGVGGRDVEVDAAEIEQLAAVPQAADAEVDLGAVVDAHRVEPQVVPELAREIRPAVEFRPVPLAAPTVVAVRERVHGVLLAAEHHGSPDPPPLLEVAGDLIEAHARRMRVAVGGARRLPAHVEAVRAVAVAEPEALEGRLPVDAE